MRECTFNGMTKSKRTWALPGFWFGHNRRTSSEQAAANAGSRLIVSLWRNQWKWSRLINTKEPHRLTRWSNSNFNSSRHSSVNTFVFFNTSKSILRARHWMISDLDDNRKWHDSCSNDDGYFRWQTSFLRWHNVVGFPDHIVFEIVDWEMLHLLEWSKTDIDHLIVPKKSSSIFSHTIW